MNILNPSLNISNTFFFPGTQISNSFNENKCGHYTDIWYTRYKCMIISDSFVTRWLSMAEINCMQGRLLGERKLPSRLHLTEYINDYFPKLLKILKNVAQLSWMILWKIVILCDRHHHTAVTTHQLKWVHDRTAQVSFFTRKFCIWPDFCLNVMLLNFSAKHESTVTYYNFS